MMTARLMNGLVYLLGAMIPLVLMGCGPLYYEPRIPLNGPPIAVFNPPGAGYSPKDYFGIEGELYKTPLSCSSSSPECPHNVGQILYRYIDADGSPGVGKCVGFLVADDIVATAEHCIPAQVKNGSQRCDDQIGIRFLDNGGTFLETGDKKVFMCREMLGHAKTVDRQDYAFFSVASTGLKPFKVHKGGLKDAATLRIAKITPSDHSLGGNLKVEDCIVTMGSLIVQKFVSGWSKEGFVTGCLASPGDSGSPLYSEENGVEGIVHSVISKVDALKDAIQKQFSSIKIIFPNNFPPHALFTNLSCIPDPVTGGYDKEKCDLASQLRFADYIQPAASTNPSSPVNQQMAEWVRQLPDAVGQVIRFDAQEREVRAVPICVDAKKFEEYKRVNSQANRQVRDSSLVINYHQSARGYYSTELDNAYRMSSDINLVITEFSENELELQWLDGHWQFLVSERGPRDLADPLGTETGTKERRFVSLPECSRQGSAGDEKLPPVNAQ